jgi:hypothetical protein
VPPGRQPQGQHATRPSDNIYLLGEGFGAFAGSLIAETEFKAHSGAQPHRLLHDLPQMKKDQE